MEFTNLGTGDLMDVASRVQSIYAAVLDLPDLVAEYGLEDQFSIEDYENFTGDLLRVLNETKNLINSRRKGE